MKLFSSVRKLILLTLCPLLNHALHWPKRKLRHDILTYRSSSRFTALTLGPAWWTGLILIWSEHVWSCPDFPNLSWKIQHEPHNLSNYHPKIYKIQNHHPKIYKIATPKSTTWWTGLILIWSERVWSCPDFPNLSRKSSISPKIYKITTPKSTKITTPKSTKYKNTTPKSTKLPPQSLPHGGQVWSWSDLNMSDPVQILQIRDEGGKEKEGSTKRISIFGINKSGLSWVSALASLVFPVSCWHSEQLLFW